MYQHHSTTRLVPPGANEGVEIDTAMVPVVRGLWAKGWRTLACCQDSGQAVAAEREHGKTVEATGHQGFIEYHMGWAWLKMPADDALSLLDALASDDVFGPRVRVRWHLGSWRVFVPVVHQERGFAPAPFAQVYFPETQIPELAAALKTGGECW